MPKITRKHGLMAAGLGLALFACGDEDVASDLNTEGAPRVTTVTVLSESALLSGAIPDVATFCTTDEGEKLNLNYCPRDGGVAQVTDALPIGWELRVVFNELLNPSVENLLGCIDMNHDGACSPDVDDEDGVNHGSLVATQPVTLMCNGEEIPYDGYYQPSGNHLSIPPGPALVIEPLFPDGFAATGSSCQVTVKSDVQSKEQESMDTAKAGPFSFGIAPMAVYETDPADGGEIATDAEVAVLFNAYVDEASLAANVTVTDDAGVAVPVISLAFEDIIVVLPEAGTWAAGTTHTLTINTGVADIKGGTFAGPFTTTFVTLP